VLTQPASHARVAPQTLAAHPYRATPIHREEVVSALAAMRRAGAKLKTRALRLDVLRSCLNSAIEDGLLSANPAARAGRFLQPAPAERRREIELSVFTAEELRQVVDTARAQFPREVHILVLTLARTRLRPGEGRCLQISDVDLKARQRNPALGPRPGGTRYGIAGPGERDSADPPKQRGFDTGFVTSGTRSRARLGGRPRTYATAAARQRAYRARRRLVLVPAVSGA
jgi:integrase